MNGQKGIAFQKEVLNYIFTGVRPPVNSTIFFALFTVNPSSSTDTKTEVTGGGYARASVSVVGSNFASATQTGTDPSKTKNSVAVVWPTATADWGAITGIGIYSALTSGTLFYWMPFTKTVLSGQTLQLPANSLTTTEA